MNNRVDKIAKSDNDHCADPDWNAIRRGWYIGDNIFRNAMIDRVESILYGKDRKSHNGDMVHLHNEKQAELLKKQGLSQLGITDADLHVQSKGSPEKKVLIWFIHSRTTVRNQWLSDHLYCGHPSNIARFVYEVNNSKEPYLKRLKKKLLK